MSQKDKLMEAVVKKLKMEDHFQFFSFLNNPAVDARTLDRFMLEHNICSGFIIAEDTAHQKAFGGSYTKRYIYTDCEKSLVHVLKKLQQLYPKQFCLYAMLPNTYMPLIVDIDFKVPKKWQDVGVKVSISEVIDSATSLLQLYLMNNIKDNVIGNFRNMRCAWYSSSRPLKGESNHVFIISLHLLNDSVIFANKDTARIFWARAVAYYNNEVENMKLTLSLPGLISKGGLVKSFGLKVLTKIDLGIYRNNSLVRLPYSIKKGKPASCKTPLNRFARELSLSQHVAFHFGDGKRLYVASSGKNDADAKKSTLSASNISRRKQCDQNTDSAVKNIVCEDKRVNGVCPEAKRVHRSNAQIMKTYRVSYSDWTASTLLCLDPECSNTQHVIKAAGGLRFPFGWYNLHLNVNALKIIENELIKAINNDILKVIDVRRWFFGDIFRHNVDDNSYTLFGTKNLVCNFAFCKKLNSIQAKLVDNSCTIQCINCKCMSSIHPKQSYVLLDDCNTYNR